MTPSKILSAIGFSAFFVGGMIAYSTNLVRHSNQTKERINLSITSTRLGGQLRSIEPMTLTEIESAISSYQVWKQRESRTIAIAARFALIARDSGALQSVSQGFELFAKANIPEAIRDAAVESLVITALREKQPAREELLKIISVSGPFLAPCIRGVAFAATGGKTCVEKYRELASLLIDSGILRDSTKDRLILNTAVQSAETLSLNSLNALVSEIADAKEDVLVEIAKDIAASDLALAIQFSADNAKENTKLFVKMILGLGLDKVQMRAVTAQLDSKSANRFAEAYIDATASDIQVRIEMSDCISPLLLNEKYRATFAGNLINFTGAQAATWIAQLPEEDRVKLMIKLNQGGAREVNAKSWLAVASQVPGVPEGEYLKAIQSAAFNHTFEELEPYLAKLSSEHRQTVELDLHFREFRKLNMKDAGEMISFIESKPEAYREKFYDAAGGALVKNSVKDALDIFEKTENPKLKESIKSCLRVSDISAEDYWRVFGAEISTASPDAVSIRAHDYVGGLLKSDSDKALKFALGLPDSPLRDGVMQVLAREWATKNPETASDWITQLPAGSSRDVALYELTKASKDEPESAFANIASISSKSQRFGAAMEVVGWWKTRDQKKITEIITSSKLSQPEQAVLLEELKK